MSEAPAIPPRLIRGAELLPVFAALALHALAHNRWLLCIPAAGLVAVLLFLGRQLAYSPRRLMIAAIVGAAVGSALSGLWPVLGPIPPIVMGPLCGALVGLTTFCGVSGRQTYAITYALLLASLSVAVRGSEAVYGGIGVVITSLLITAFVRGRMHQAGLVGALTVGLFILVIAGAGLGVARLVRSAEGVLTDAVFRLAQKLPRPSELALQSEISLAYRGRMPETDQLLMELRGDRPERLRTVVFDAFDGLRWTTSPELKRTQRALPPPSPGEPLRSTELTVLQSLRTYLPAPAGIRAVEGAVPTILGGSMVRANVPSGSTLTLRGEPQEQLPPEPPPDESLTALPEELRAELRPLALELTRNATTPRARAQALERWFRDNFQYSLSVDLRGEGNPLAIFIRERRPAWCTYFASGMAALLRSLGTPARMVGGFVPQEKNPFSEAFLIRDRDAHAWVEVYLEDEGRFVAFDPTPWRSRDAITQARETGTLSAAWQAFTSGLRRRWERLMSAPLEALSAVASAPVTWLVVAAVVAWRLRATYQRTRASRGREAMAGADPKLATAYARYLRAMKRGAGLVPRPTETDEELLLRLRTAHGAQAGALAEEFLTRYRRARYGGGAIDPASLGTLTSELERLLRQTR